MTSKLKRVVAISGLLFIGALGFVALTSPTSAEGCKPVGCPAIAKLCPQGQIACRVSPCNCALACQPEGVGCNQ